MERPVISNAALDHLHGILTEPDLSATRYQLLSVLGRGGMGVVYLARDTTLDRDVALKVVDWSFEEASTSRLALEARILATLEHPGIVPIHDFGQLVDGRTFYAMKRVRGERLDAWCARVHDLHERLGVFLRICEPVAFAHARGIIHRDLKPENVMVGEFGEVLVLDWGIARLREGSELGAQGLGTAGPGTGHGTVLGTPHYMAPEQARGDPGVDQTADIYSLGAILAGLAHNRRPLRAIAAKAMAAERSQRYQTVPALSRDVARFIAGQAVDALRESARDRLARFIRRHRLPLALIATYIVVRAVLLLLFRV